MSALLPLINEDRYLVLVDADDDVFDILTIACEDTHVLEALVRDLGDL